MEFGFCAAICIEGRQPCQFGDSYLAHCQQMDFGGLHKKADGFLRKVAMLDKILCHYNSNSILDNGEPVGFFPVTFSIHPGYGSYQ